MDTKLVTFAALYLLFLFPCVSRDPTCNHGRIVHTGGPLLAACSMSMLTSARPNIPHKLRRRRQRRHAGALVWANGLASHANPAPGVTPEGSGIMLIVERWLIELTPDTNATLEWLNLQQARGKILSQCIHFPVVGWIKVHFILFNFF